MSTTPHDGPFLHVTEQAWGDIRPHAAFVHVTLTSDKLFSGRAALTKAAELRRLVEALAEHGFRDDDAVALEGVSLDVTTGLFTRSSSVTYRVRIRITELDRLANALDAVAACKQATLSHVSWDYTGSRELDDVLASCATRAMAKATRLASALGLALDAIHTVDEGELAEPVHYVERSMAMDMVMARKSRSISSELSGLDLAPTKRHGVRVRIVYRIAQGRTPI